MVIDMGFLVEVFKFIIYSLIIVYISKAVLVKLLRKLAEILDLSPKAVRKYCRSCNFNARTFNSIFLIYSGANSELVYII